MRIKILLRLQHNLNQFFTERPFSAMYYTYTFLPTEFTEWHREREKRRKTL